MEILKTAARTVGLLILLAIAGFAGWYIKDKSQDTVSQFEYKVVLLAQALDGEARGHETEWPHVASAIFARVQDRRWPDSLEQVLLQKRSNGTGCMVDAMCDTHMENLLTDSGRQAREYAAAALHQFNEGTFTFTHPGHSWATPKAAADHAYFSDLLIVAQGAAHHYFGDKPMRPRARPNCLLGCVLDESVRPRVRPTAIVNPVELAVRAAMQE